MIAGEFRPFVITCPEESDTLCIIAYHGDSIPTLHNRTVKNYYRWEYEHGSWKDTSNHSLEYINPSQCYRENTTFHFNISMDIMAQPGQWNIIIFNTTKTKSTTSHTYALVLTPMNLFLTALLGCYQPIQHDKKSFDDFLLCSEQKKEVMVSKQNINDIVDKILARQIYRKDDSRNEAEKDHTIFYYPEKVDITDDIEQTTTSNYPRSKLKYASIITTIIEVLTKWRRNIFQSIQSLDVKQFFTFFIIFLFLGLHFAPTINPEETDASSYPVIESFTIVPQQVYPGEEIVFTASIADSQGIFFIGATIENQTTIPLYFITGSTSNNSYINGLWQNHCTTHGFLIKNYTVVLTITDIKNNTVYIHGSFSVIAETNQGNTIHLENQSYQIPAQEPKINDSFQTNTSNTSRSHNQDLLYNESENQTSNQNESFIQEFNNTSDKQQNNQEPILMPIQTNISKFDQNILSILDKRHEHIDIIPGTRFLVERTINATYKTNVTFVPMFSTALSLESIELIEPTHNSTKNIAYIVRSNQQLDAAKNLSSNDTESIIRHLRQSLTVNIQNLDKIAIIDTFQVQSPITVRMWFRAPSWEELYSNKDLKSGEISYLIFSNDNTSQIDFEGSTWWSSTWNYRKLLTINSSQVEADLTNFPVLVSITDSDLILKAQDDGDDIVFVLDETDTKLNHEIERFNSTTGELVAWVNVTNVRSTADTLIWMYYNNSACANQENVGGTWDSNYLGVWHFGSSLNDSTANMHNAVNSGTTYSPAGKIAGARTYSGDHSIDINSFSTISTAMTAEAWVYRDITDTTTFIRLFTEGPDWNDNDWCLYWRTAPRTMRYIINGGDTAEGGTYDLSAQWFQAVVTYQTGDAYLYNNGILEEDWSGDFSTSIDNIYDTLSIGNQNGGGRPWIGSMDEVRISKIQRSAAWILTSYNTMNSPQTFLRYGSESNITDTTVDTIIPYTISFSPLSITATAAQGLNHVSLWYRHSSNNLTWGTYTNFWYDYLAPWQWSFTFPNGTGYYEFYSIGNKTNFPEELVPNTADTKCYFDESLNTLPEVTLINPSPNGTADVSRQPICQILVNDSDGDTLTVTWYENSTGTWILRQTNSSIVPNTYVSWTYTQANLHNTRFWWRVNVDDGTENITNIFYFTTEAIKTTVNTITPYIIINSPVEITANGDSDLTNVSLYYRWSENNFTWTTLTYDDFEGISFDWGNYTDGGADCLAYTDGTFAHQGTNAVNIQDNTDISSSFYFADGFDVDTPGYKYICVDFWFRAVDMEVGEDFWVRYFDGSSWVTVASFVSGTDFVNNQFYHRVVWINESVYAFPSNMQIRFQCDASNDADDVYIDEIYVNASTEPGNYSEWAVWSGTGNPDTLFPWSWNFDFPNNFGYYEFYSIGKKSGATAETAPLIADAHCYYNSNPAPIIQVIYPFNGSTTIPIQPQCQIQANDGNGDSLTICWYENTTGSWVLRQKNSSITANSSVHWIYTQATNNAITYWWRVTVNDGVNNISSAQYFTTVSLQSSVNSVSPYIITYTPLQLSATGDSSFSNITLYYRWSENNFTWTTLTYDDFEGISFDWGNYTDGGEDCLAYTDGTFAHQGTNAVNIQDDNAIPSSFSSSSGIDVASPGYKYICVDFWFRAVDMEVGEDFWVRYFDGSSWVTVASFVSGTDFVNNQFYHRVVWINESVYAFPSNMQIRFQCDASNDADDVYIDEIYVNASTEPGNYTEWAVWSGTGNPDTLFPWSWNFDFPHENGYYEFYSIAKKSGSTNEPSPHYADAYCYFYSALLPIINDYNLVNITGSKLNNVTGLLDIHHEYIFTINITEPNGWGEITYVNITAWYDQGNDTTIYNQTQGGNLNMFLQYENITGTAQFTMRWPDDEAELITANCSEKIVDGTTRIINISFRPLNQIRWASSNDSWTITENAHNDLYSWNFNVTVTDQTGLVTWVLDEYGVYKYTSIEPAQNWVGVYAPPGFSDTSTIVPITYSSNYDFNIVIYFEENLTNVLWGVGIPIANNVRILAAGDPNDDITTDITFTGIGEYYAIDIFNISGYFQPNATSQIVNVQFEVYVPFGTLGVRYVAHVATKIFQDKI